MKKLNVENKVCIVILGILLIIFAFCEIDRHIKKRSLLTYKEQIKIVDSKASISNCGGKISNEIDYDDGKSVGYSVYFYLEQKLYDVKPYDYTEEDRLKELFMSKFLEEFSMKKLYNEDKKRNLKVGIIDGFNYCWDKRVKNREKEKMKDEMVKRAKTIIDNLPVQEKE